VLNDSKKIGVLPQEARLNSLSDNPLPFTNTLLPPSVYNFTFDKDDSRSLRSLGFHSSIKRATSHNAENSATKRDLKMLRHTLEREHSLAAVQLPGASLDVPASPSDFSDDLTRQISELSLVNDSFAFNSIGSLHI